MTTFAHFRNHLNRVTACLVVFCCMTASVARAGLSVSNVRAAQRVGTKYVDIYYDLTDDGAGTPQPVSADLSISGDDGKTFVVPVASLSGAGFGAGQTAGKDKLITWNAGVDWDNQVSPNMRFQVKAVLASPDGLVLIPAGSFMMGDSTGAAGSTTVRTVQVSAFYIAKYEVTKALWDEVRTWGASHGYTDLAVGEAKAADHPVETVSWYDAAKWCNARSEKEGRTLCYTIAGTIYKTGSSSPVCNWNADGYRLPTNAEWEKAARGGKFGWIFPWGNTITHSQANYSSNSSYSYPYDISPTSGNHPAYAVGGHPYTSPVGSFAPNGFGLYDMAGNLFEFCWDWIGNETAQTDPRGPTSGTARGVRGGDWSRSAYDSRVDSQSYGTRESDKGNTLGCRIARSSVH